MEVKTQHTSPVADKAQQGVMELLLINHPLDCPVCDKGGECPLQNQAMSQRPRAQSRFEDVKRTYPKPINISSQVLLDRERCVLCARCTRFSDQIAGDPFIALVERGALQQVGIYEDQPFESYFSGNTVQICPVGALTGAAYRFRSRPFDLVSTPSRLRALRQRLRHPHRPPPRRRCCAGWPLNDPAVNEEWNCDKGRWAFTYADAGRPDPDAAGARRGAASCRSPPGPRRSRPRPAAWPRPATPRASACSSAAASAAEDAYAYGKFARIALRHQRHRLPRPPALGRGGRLPRQPRRGHRARTAARSPTPTSSAPGPSSSSASSPRTSPRSSSCGCARPSASNKTAVYAVAPFATRGLDKLGGTLLPAAPGTEAEVLAALADGSHDGADPAWPRPPRRWPASGVVARRRAARRRCPARCPRPRRLAAATGARLAWVPRRAGERGALEAGALPSLLPGGRPVTDAAARAEVGRGLGRRRPARHARPRHRRRSSPRPAPASSAALRRRRRRPGRPGGARRARWTR